MMKLTKKGFTLIELLAVIVILAILVAVSIPAVTKYLTTARKGTYATNATTAIDAYRNYIVSNGITKASSMTLAELNDLLEKKLTTSSYGSAYEDFSTIYVTFDSNLIPTYSICLVDSEGNGIYSGTGESVAETSIKGESVELAGTITSCSINPNLLPTTTETAFEFDSSTHAITNYDPGIGGYDVVIPSTIGGVSVTAIGDYSMGGYGLTSLTIPNSVTSIGVYALTGNYLTSVVLPSSLSELREGAFADNQITSIIIPDNVTYIGQEAFVGNDLTSINIPNSVTYIGSGAFQDNNLTTVTIGTGVTEINANAFRKHSTYNQNLTSIINKTGRSFDWGLIANGSSNYNFVTGTIVNTYGNIIVSAS